MAYRDFIKISMHYKKMNRLLHEKVKEELIL